MFQGWLWVPHRVPEQSKPPLSDVAAVPAAVVQVGRLWTALADFHIRRAAFEVARDVYEEGLAAVATVRDFGLIFDALRCDPSPVFCGTLLPHSFRSISTGSSPLRLLATVQQ